MPEIKQNAAPAPAPAPAPASASASTPTQEQQDNAARVIQRHLKARLAYKRMGKAPYYNKPGATPIGPGLQESGSKAFEVKSKQNLSLLIKKLGTLTSVEREFLVAYINTGSELTHYTRAKDPIISSGRVLSHKVLDKRGIKTNSTPDDKVLGNGDFIFFRYEITHDETQRSRFGHQQLVMAAEQTELFKTGWISLFEMLHPETASILSSLKDQDTVLRTGKKAPGVNNKFRFHYPKTAQTLELDLDEYVFYGPNIKLGLCLSIIEQLRAIGGEFQESGLSDLSSENFSILTKKLFRPEAKIPHSVELQVTPYRIVEGEPESEKEISDHLHQNIRIEKYVNDLIKEDIEYSKFNDQFNIISKIIFKPLIKQPVITDYINLNKSSVNVVKNDYSKEIEQHKIYKLKEQHKTDKFKEQLLTMFNLYNNTGTTLTKDASIEKYYHLGKESILPLSSPIAGCATISSITPST